MQMKPQKRFEAKKVLEAFDMIKKNLRNPEGLGQFLGRSRKERELDKHFNHQTKEIKAEIKNKKKSRAERLHNGKVQLFGEKTDRIKKFVPEKKKKRLKPENMDVIVALHRIVTCLRSSAKFQ